MRWVCSPLHYTPATSPGTELCTIYYASLNFRDIMLATGKLSPDAIPGTRPADMWPSPSQPGAIPQAPAYLLSLQGSGPCGTVCWAWSSQAGTPAANV